jgi:hypothetical protein
MTAAKTIISRLEKIVYRPQTLISRRLETSLVVVAHRQPLEVREQPLADAELHALPGAGHHEDRVPLEHDDGRQQ